MIGQYIAKVTAFLFSDGLLAVDLKSECRGRGGGGEPPGADRVHRGDGGVRPCAPGAHPCFTIFTKFK